MGVQPAYIPVLVLVLPLPPPQAFFLNGSFNSFVGNVAEPVIFGDKFDLHEVTVLGALALWGVIWGISGAVLSARAPLPVRGTRAAAARVWGVGQGALARERQGR